MSYLDDPRVFFAAEQTLLAWQRMGIALVELGFVVERFGLFLRFVAAGRELSAAQPTASVVLAVVLPIVGAALSPISAKNANTSSRTNRTSDSPDRPLAQIDQRKRSRGIVAAVRSTLAVPPRDSCTALPAAALSGFFSSQSPANGLL